MSFNPTAVDFHPFSEELPLMPAKELGRIEEDMKEHGYDERFPIVIYRSKILDGRNRYLAAQAAEVEPTYIHFEGGDEEARRFVRIANEERRHLAAEWLQRRRQERLERVAEARREGKSTREIAEAEGVSQPQVISDIKKATKQGVPVETPDGKVQGKDGKKQSARKPANSGDNPLSPEDSNSTDEHEPSTEHHCSVDENGDDRPGKRNAKPPKAGAVLFDFKAFFSEFGRIAQAPDKIATAYPDEKGGKDYTECRKHLEAFLRAFKAWQARLQKESAQ